MRRTIAFCVAVTLYLIAASPALAASFTGSAFTATGSMSVSISGGPTFACTVNLSGVVNADGTAAVTNSNITGVFPSCSLMRLTTPFNLEANSVTSVTVTSLEIAGYFSCGPQAVTATWTNNNPSQFRIYPIPVNPGGCRVGLYLNVTGATIVP